MNFLVFQGRARDRDSDWGTKGFEVLKRGFKGNFWHQKRLEGAGKSFAWATGQIFGRQLVQRPFQNEVCGVHPQPSVQMALTASDQECAAYKSNWELSNCDPKAPRPFTVL